VTNLANPATTNPHRLYPPEPLKPFASDEARAVHLYETHAFRQQQASIRAIISVIGPQSHRARLNDIDQRTAAKALHQAQREAINPPRDINAWVTSLDPVETSGISLNQSSFSPRDQARKEFAYTLHTTGTLPPHHAKAAKIYACGEQLWVALGPDGPVTIRERCHRRECPNCREWRGHQVTQAAEKLIATWPRYKFLTLTRKPTGLALRDEVQSLLRDFNRLRRTALWRASAGQGIYVVEITKNKETGNFHTHLHALFRGTYLPQEALAKQWSKITNGSFMVWISAGTFGRAHYLGKYVGKGLAADVEKDQQWHYWEQLAGLRLCGTFGGAPSIESLQPPADKTLIAPLEVVQRWAIEGDPFAVAILNELTAKFTRDSTPLPDTATCSPPRRAKPPD
jgi:hypothetical protein